MQQHFWLIFWFFSRFTPWTTVQTTQNSFQHLLLLNWFFSVSPCKFLIKLIWKKIIYMIISPFQTILPVNTAVSDAMILKDPEMINECHLKCCTFHCSCFWNDVSSWFKTGFTQFQCCAQRNATVYAVHCHRFFFTRQNEYIWHSQISWFECQNIIVWFSYLFGWR